MSGFAGFFDAEESLTDEKYLWMALARRMAQRLSHRGPDGRGAHVSSRCAVAHVQRSVPGAEYGAQPMTCTENGRTATIVWDGELCNADELRTALSSRGCSLETHCDAEIALKSYLCFGPACAERMNGVFAFAVDDVQRESLLLCRDRFGAKPLFYTFSGGRLVFASEIKALFEYPGVRPRLGRTGICEIFGIGPARTPGCGVYKSIKELLPGHTAVFSREGFSPRPYFKLEAHPYTEDYDATVQRVRALLEDIASRQLDGAVPLAAAFSGGTASAAIAALAAMRQTAGGGLPLDAYAPAYDDTPPAAEALPGIRQHTLHFDAERMADTLTDAVIARDLPGMAGLDGSALCLFREIRKRHAAALCGIGADAAFAGWPWLFKRHPAGLFPWSSAPLLLAGLLRPELAADLQVEDYVRERRCEMTDAAPVLRGESAENRRFRENSFLSLYGFMGAQLECLDRYSMYSGLEVRTPYTDYRLIEYLFNAPRDIRAPQGRINGLFYDACRGLLPDEVFGGERNQGAAVSAACSPQYTRAVRERLTDVLRDPEQPIHRLISADAARRLLREKSDRPWFGVQAAEAQLSAYLLQINLWLNRYKVKIDL